MLKNYLSLIKFSHTIFAMPFALTGFSLAIKSGIHSDKPWWQTLILVVLCMIFARSAAMGFNRWLDAKYDALNPRTAIREIPAGIIQSKNAFFFVVISSLAFIVCTWFINILCFYLSFVALFVVLFYSYTKRFTPLCHLVLGAGLSLAPIGAYLAVTATFALLPLLFSFIVFFWVSGFDIIYALQDEEFDKTNNLYSIPAALGKKNALMVSNLLHLICAGIVVFAGFYGSFHLLYWIGAAVFLGLLIYQHTIVKPHDLSKVDLAFGTTNGIASVIFAAFVIADIFIN